MGMDGFVLLVEKQDHCRMLEYGVFPEGQGKRDGVGGNKGKKEVL